MLLQFNNKTILDGHPLLKIRTVFVNLGGNQFYIFLIQGNTRHYLYPNLASRYHLAFVTPPIHPTLLRDIHEQFCVFIWLQECPNFIAMFHRAMLLRL